jgi:methylated-DNA-protein-cysteine methyltransferase-like protein
LVGHALGSLPDSSGVPWHRVVNHSGGISPREYPDAVERQRHALQREGIKFLPSGRISLAIYGWRVFRRV